MKFLRYVFIGLIFILFAWISITLMWLNKDPVDVNLLFTTVNIEIGMALLGFFISGVALGISFMVLPVAKRSLRARSLDRKLTARDKEIENIRKLPMQ